MKHGYLLGADQEGESGAEAGALDVACWEQDQFCLWILPPKSLPKIGSFPSAVSAIPKQSQEVYKMAYVNCAVCVWRVWG